MRTYVEHNGKEVKGIKKLKYLTISDIVEAYLLIPLNDICVRFLKWLNNKISTIWKEVFLCIIYVVFITNHLTKHEKKQWKLAEKILFQSSKKAEKSMLFCIGDWLKQRIKMSIIWKEGDIMKICFHKWKYICHGHLECMPNDEIGISLLFRCTKCGKEKTTIYIE